MSEARPLPPEVASRSFAEQSLWLNDKLGELGWTLSERRAGEDVREKTQEIVGWAETLVASSNRIEPRSLMMLGMALRLTGDVDGARDAFARVTEIDPEFVGAWLELAWAHAAQKRHTDALQALQHALTLEPDHAGALGYLAALHTDMNNLDEAHAVITRALEIDPDNTLIKNLAHSIDQRRNAPWWRRLLTRLLPPT